MKWNSKLDETMHCKMGTGAMTLQSFLKARSLRPSTALVPCQGEGARGATLCSREKPPLRLHARSGRQAWSTRALRPQAFAPCSAHTRRDSGSSNVKPKNHGHRDQAVNIFMAASTALSFFFAFFDLSAALDGAERFACELRDPADAPILMFTPSMSVWIL